MNSRTIPDLTVNQTVRRAFVRHQIDLGWLSLHTCRGTVYVQGELWPLPGVKSELTPALVGTLFDEIRSSAGVSHMVVELRNWNHNSFSAGWMPTTNAVTRRSLSSATPSSNVFEIEAEKIQE